MDCILEWFQKDKAPRVRLACAALVATIDRHLESHDLRAISAGLAFLAALWRRISTPSSPDTHGTHGTLQIRHTRLDTFHAT